MQRPILVGEYDFTFDAKNRIAVPARLRSAFADGVYVTKVHPHCLAGYAPEEFKEYLERQMEGISPRSSKGRDLMRFTAGNAVYQELDGQGRITVPAKHLEFAGINREVSIIGVQDHLEIWDRAAWADHQSRLEEEADATADEHATS
ncbi:MAG: division/cell wall cluster transcriptional repressor MraZ [Actinobacteria bacterium]|nr:division/cell wall cluster transcriptional repressor MraZ [Actinomycetota bacterium]